MLLQFEFLILFLELFLLLPAVAQDQPDLALLMSNLVNLQTSELTLIVASKHNSTLDQLQIIQGAFEDNQLPIYLYDTQGTSSFPKVDCQTNDLERQEYHKDDNRRSQVFFTITQIIKELDIVVKNLLSTVMNCPSRQAGGYFRNENIFAFYSLLPDESREHLFHTYETQRHPHIALFNQMSTNDGLLMDRYDVHTDQVIRSSLWRKGQYEYPTLRSLFPWIDMSGYTLKTSSIPFSYLCYADVVEDPSDPQKAYANYAGYDIDMIMEPCKKMNCNVEFFNPADFLWGTLNNGTYTGHFGEVVNRKVDMVTGAIVLTYLRSMSGVYTYPLGTAGLTFLSPKPKQLVHQYDTLITPVQDIVWIFLLVFLGVIIVCMYKVSRVEEYIIPDKNLKHWSKFGNAIWYAFSTLIGESVTRDSKSDGAWALRIIIGSWLILSLIFSSSYGGNLRAFLMTPRYEQAIENMEDVVNSDLAWSMVTYGEEVETYLDNSEDPVEQTFWNGRTIIDFAEFPYDAMKAVYERKQIMIEWVSLVEILLMKYLSRQNGEYVVHYTKDFITPVQGGNSVKVVMMNTINPWTERFRHYIDQYNEVGIFEVWKAKHIEYYNDKYIKPLNVQPFVTQNDEADENSVHPLSLAELIGVVLMLGTFMFLCIVVFVSERYLVNGQRGNIDLIMSTMKSQTFSTKVTRLQKLGQTSTLKYNTK